MQLRLSALAAELRRALRALLPLRLAHRFPGEAVHFLRGRDGGAGNWRGRRRRRHRGDPGARRLPRRLARAIGGGPARRACAPAPRAPGAPPSRFASCSSPDCASRPHPRAARPPPGAGGGEGGGARAWPHKLLTPGAEGGQAGGRRRARSLDGRGERAAYGRRTRLAAPLRAESGQVFSGCRPRRPPGPEPPPGALPSRVRASRRRALVLPSAPAPHRPGRPPAPRSVERRPRSASRAHRPPTEHAREATATT